MNDPQAISTFCPSVGEEEIARRLWSLKQGNRPVSDLAIDFRILAAESGWNRPALKAAFLQALNENLKDELATRDEPHSLDDLIFLAIKLDARLRERPKTRDNAPSRSAPVHLQSIPDPVPDPSFIPTSSDPEPMQIGSTRLTPAERNRRIRTRVCLYCGEKGHFIAACPIRPKGGARQ